MMIDPMADTEEEMHILEAAFSCNLKSLTIKTLHFKNLAEMLVSNATLLELNITLT